MDTRYINVLDNLYYRMTQFYGLSKPREYPILKGFLVAERIGDRWIFPFNSFNDPLISRIYSDEDRSSRYDYMLIPVYAGPKIMNYSYNISVSNSGNLIKLPFSNIYALRKVYGTDGYLFNGYVIPGVLFNDNMEPLIMATRTNSPSGVSQDECTSLRISPKIIETNTPLSRYVRNVILKYFMSDSLRLNREAYFKGEVELVIEDLNNRFIKISEASERYIDPIENSDNYIHDYLKLRATIDKVMDMFDPVSIREGIVHL